MIKQCFQIVFKQHRQDFEIYLILVQSNDNKQILVYGLINMLLQSFITDMLLSYNNNFFYSKIITLGKYKKFF